MRRSFVPRSLEPLEATDLGIELLNHVFTVALELALLLLLAKRGPVLGGQDDAEDLVGTVGSTTVEFLIDSLLLSTRAMMDSVSTMPKLNSTLYLCPLVTQSVRLPCTANLNYGD